VIISQIERNIGFHKMRGISWLAGELLPFQEQLCSVKLVSQLVSSVSLVHPIIYSILKILLCPLFHPLYLSGCY